MSTVIILGSSRKEGVTKKLVSELVSISNCDVIDLSEYNFTYYDYEHNNRGDDYLGLLQTVIKNYDTLIFATPVYWYAMSGIMKVFFDRITDLITIEKDLGRKLRGKYMAVITTSNGNNLGENFWLPFKHTAEYLGINYVTNLHTSSQQLNIEELNEFMHLIEQK